MMNYHHHHSNSTPPRDAFTSHHRVEEEGRPHDYRLRAALRGLDRVAIECFDDTARTRLDHDSLAALGAALRCASLRAEPNALYRLRLVVAPTWSDAERAIEAAAITPLMPGVRTHNGLLSLRSSLLLPVGGATGGAPADLSSIVRLCALARITPELQQQQQQQASSSPVVLCCHWQNLFAPTTLQMMMMMREEEEGQVLPRVEEAPLYFFAQQRQLFEGPPFELNREEAVVAVAAWSSSSSSSSPTGSNHHSAIIQGCIWGVVINTEWADPAAEPATLYDVEPPLRWPADLCVCSDLCPPCPFSLSGFQRPRFAFVAADASTAAAHRR
jgi:hypothetical protein